MGAPTQYSYGQLPEQAQEDALHATRLLSVEERPFQRVIRSLLGKESALRWSTKQLPSPPPEDGDAPLVDEGAAQRTKFSEDILLDFVALESSASRMQLIQNSNRRERERYATEKAKILETAQAVRDNNIELRAQLAQAQQILELRKGYDNLAKKLIPDDNKLQPREACMEDIEKLEKEIEDLQHESAGCEATWLSRREAFDRVVEEGQAMLRLIKGIKDEPEGEGDKDERMEDEDGDDEGTKGERSLIGTPMPDVATPVPETFGGESPRPNTGDDAAEPNAKPSSRLLQIDDFTRSTSRASSPGTHVDGNYNDTEMDGAEGKAHVSEEQTMEEKSTVEPRAPSSDAVDEMDET